MKDRTAAAATPSAREAILDAAATAELRHDGTHWRLAAGGPGDLVRAPLGVVPALERAIAIIAYLNAAAPRAVALAELSQRLAISKSHCFSLLKTLVHHEWLHFDAAAKTYRLQSGILRDASSVLHDSSVIALIRPALTTLARRVGVPAVLSQPLVDDSFVVVDKFDAPHLMEVSFPIGHRFSRNACAQMRALLAWTSPARIERWFESWQPIRYTERTPTDGAMIRAELAATRARGWARSVGEFTEGLMALALPIFDRHGEVVFVFNVATLIPVLAPREDEVAAQLIRTAAEIHHATGATVPDDFPRPEPA